jgi:hypothetical protein
LRYLINRFGVDENSTHRICLVVDGDKAGTDYKDIFESLRLQSRGKVIPLAKDLSIEDYCLSNENLKVAVGEVIQFLDPKAAEKKSEILEDIFGDVKTRPAQKATVALSQTNLGARIKNSFKTHSSTVPSKTTIARLYADRCRSQKELKPDDAKVAMAMDLIKSIVKHLQLPQTKSIDDVLIRSDGDS